MKLTIKEYMEIYERNEKSIQKFIEEEKARKQNVILLQLERMKRRLISYTGGDAA